jgi:enamine deaminase RidA (YjgF/YER057c/UK114 family)
VADRVDLAGSAAATGSRFGTPGEAARAHAERFAQVRPATTFVEVSRFVDPQWLVEFEVNAIVPD